MCWEKKEVVEMETDSSPASPSLMWRTQHSELHGSDRGNHIPEEDRSMPGTFELMVPQPSVQEKALKCQSQPRNQLYPVKSSHPSRCKFNSFSSLVKILSPPIPTPRALSLSHLKSL